MPTSQKKLPKSVDYLLATAVGASMLVFLGLAAIILLGLPVTVPWWLFLLGLAGLVGVGQSSVLIRVIP